MKDIIRNFQILQPDGSYSSIPRKKSKLSDDAVPNIFPNCPSYLTSTQSKPDRFSRDVKEAELFRKAIKQILEQQVSDEEMYKLYTFQQLRERMNSLTLPYDSLLWNSNDNSVHFLRPTHVNEQLLLDSSMSIDSSLNVKAKRGTYAVPLSLNIIDDTRQIDLLKEVMDFQIPTGTPDQPIEKHLNAYVYGAITQIKFAIAECKNLDLDSDTFTNQTSSNINTIQQRLQFILCQVENTLLYKKRRRYKKSLLKLLH